MQHILPTITQIGAEQAALHLGHVYYINDKIFKKKTYLPQLTSLCSKENVLNANMEHVIKLRIRTWKCSCMRLIASADIEV